MSGDFERNEYTRCSSGYAPVVRPDYIPMEPQRVEVDSNTGVQKTETNQSRSIPAKNADKWKAYWSSDEYKTSSSPKLDDEDKTI